MTSGEYKSYIVFKEIPIKEKEKNNTNKVDAQIKMITEVGISIYGYYGNIDKGINISDLKLSYNEKNELIAFSNLLTTENKNEIAIDLMRYTDFAPAGTMK